MLISTAHAQAAGGGGGDLMIQLLPLVLIFVVFYFLLIRPQQKRMKQHKEMLANVRRGDRIVTNGGLVGTVTKVDEDDDMLNVDIADGVRVKVVRSMIAEVRGKGEPVSSGKKKGGKSEKNEKAREEKAVDQKTADADADDQNTDEGADRDKAAANDSESGEKAAEKT